MKEINVLLLGQTGVGKSTFINAFANYMTSKTLEDALKKEPESLIYSSFQFYVPGISGPQGKILVEIGKKDDNEGIPKACVQGNCETEQGGSNNPNNQSSTQEPRAYRFLSGSIAINLIDTPGIGDTRGSEYDEKNCRNIISFLKRTRHLHGILFLLKSNVSRLSPEFVYCFKEVLTQFHRSACENIRFVYTHSAGEFFTPGSTISLVEDIATQVPVKLNIDSDDPLCVDSQAFRYMALKHTLQQDDYLDPKFDKIRTQLERYNKNYQEAWTHSSEAVMQILQRFSKADPHDIGDTYELNRVRDQILNVTTPLAEIVSLVRHRKQDLLKQMKIIEDCGTSIEDLEKHLMGSYVEAHECEQPNTVCVACEKAFTDADGHFHIIEHPCHSPCFLKNVPESRVGLEALRHCAAMTFQRGTQLAACDCGHSYVNHMHTTIKKVVVQKKRPDIVMRIDDLKKQNISAQSSLESLEKQIAALDEEHELIFNAAAEFGCFLTKYSMFPYNSATKEYLLLQISNKHKEGLARDSPEIQDLEHALEVFETKKKSIDEALHKASEASEVGDITVVNMEKRIKQLFGLKHFGKLIETYAKKNRPDGFRFVDATCRLDKGFDHHCCIEVQSSQREEIQNRTSGWGWFPALSSFHRAYQWGMQLTGRLPPQVLPFHSVGSDLQLASLPANLAPETLSQETVVDIVKPSMQQSEQIFPETQVLQAPSQILQVPSPSQPQFSVNSAVLLPQAQAQRTPEPQWTTDVHMNAHRPPVLHEPH